MKRTLISLIACGGISVCPAAIQNFDLSPPGTDVAVGLSSSNEVGLPVASTGSGNELLGGITLDTDTSTLSFNVGYGSSAGFLDLTGPATAAHFHGPATTGQAAGVLIDLASFHVPATNPALGGVIAGSVVLTSENVSNLLAGLLYLNIHTATNQDGEIRGQLIAVTNNAPTITCPLPVTFDCTSSNGALATVSVLVADQDNEALQVTWAVNGMPIQTNSLAAGTTSAGTSVSFTAEFGSGHHDIFVSVTDGANVVTCPTAVEVVDTTPPTIASISATPNRLWPPNHKFVPVRVDVQAGDICGTAAACRIVGVTSDQPVHGKGKGKGNDNTGPDWSIAGDLTVHLRAERAGNNKRGRTYSISVECSDLSGNTATSIVTVFVPHDQGRGRGNSPGLPPGQGTPPPDQTQEPPKPDHGHGGKGGRHPHGDQHPSGKPKKDKDKK